MQTINRRLISVTRHLTSDLRYSNIVPLRTFSIPISGIGPSDNPNWKIPSTCSTGLKVDHCYGHSDPLSTLSNLRIMEKKLEKLEDESGHWRGSNVLEMEKQRIYDKYIQSREIYTIEKLSDHHLIMKQRVHAIIWMKELEQEKNDFVEMMNFNEKKR